MDIYLSINIYGKELETCCDNPKTGFFHNGMCDTCKEDFGVHTVCILATEDFLVFSKAVGNDLSTPRPEFNFPGVKTRQSLVPLCHALDGSLRAGQGTAGLFGVHP